MGFYSSAFQHSSQVRASDVIKTKKITDKGKTKTWFLRPWQVLFGLDKTKIKTQGSRPRPRHKCSRQDQDKTLGQNYFR